MKLNTHTYGRIPDDVEAGAPTRDDHLAKLGSKPRTGKALAVPIEQLVRRNVAVHRRQSSLDERPHETRHHPGIAGDGAAGRWCMRDRACDVGRWGGVERFQCMPFFEILVIVLLA
ncbi:hypothetical protein ACSFA0_19580 [Variovorax sp. LT1P1]|uniref:hypothetical protein n=1 Tax=Variovorax sp. LT1P1 TaxID=3443730 RepID=UPI003F46913D